MSSQGLRRLVVTPRPDSFQHMSGSYEKQLKHDMLTFPLSCMLPTYGQYGRREIGACMGLLLHAPTPRAITCFLRAVNFIDASKVYSMLTVARMS